MYRILAISGSTRAASSNRRLIQTFADRTQSLFDVTFYEGLTDLPHFNPDLLEGPPPAAVESFRSAVRESHGILICSPEYAIGVPGTLKNALDWTVSTMEFSQKPLALITASTSGVISHASLLGTLLIIEALITGPMQMVVSSVQSKIDRSGVITDGATLAALDALIESMDAVLRGEVSAENFLRPPDFHGTGRV